MSMFWLSFLIKNFKFVYRIEGNDASSTDDVFGQKHSNVEYIRRFARNYGMAASDYLRDTVQKVRQRAANLKYS